MFQVIFNQGVTSFQEMFLSDFNGGGGGGGGVCVLVFIRSIFISSDLIRG